MRQLEPIMQILIFEFSPSAAHIKTSSVKNGFIIILVLIVKLKSRSRSSIWRSSEGQVKARKVRSYVWVVALKLMASLSSTSSLNSIVNEDDEEECGFQETNVRISGCHCHCPLRGPETEKDQHSGNGSRGPATYMNGHTSLVHTYTHTYPGMYEQPGQID